MLRKFSLLYGVFLVLINEKEMHDRMMYYRNEVMVVEVEEVVDNDSCRNY